MSAQGDLSAPAAIPVGVLADAAEAGDRAAHALFRLALEVESKGDHVEVLDLLARAAVVTFKARVAILESRTGY